MVGQLSDQVAKTLLLVFNAVFFLCGLIVAVLASVDMKSNHLIKQVVEGFAGSNLAVIGVGVFICLVSSFGCFGAHTENTRILTTYKLAMIAILILQISIGVLYFMRRDELEDIVVKGARATILNIDDVAMSSSWNKVQSSFSCCGADSAEDYRISGKNIPPSCCGYAAGKACDRSDDHFNEVGCISKIIEFLKSQYLSLGCAAIIVAFIELIGILYACCLRSAIDEYELSDSSRL